jgi:hypothetical protein
LARIILGIVTVTLLATSSAFACTVRYRKSAELKAEATFVVKATVLSRKAEEPSRLGELYTYTVEVAAVERGAVEAQSKTTITYYNVHAREHGGTIECPIKDGSGNETDLRVGSSYRFFLKSKPEPEILFVESL